VDLLVVGAAEEFHSSLQLFSELLLIILLESQVLVLAGLLLLLIFKILLQLLLDCVELTL